jgi:hypothetical protein
MDKVITGLAAFLWLMPPLVFLHIWPLPMPSRVLDQIWLQYFAFALTAYLLFRWFNPEKRGPLIVGLCAVAFSIEVFNVVYFHQGDGESFRSAHFIAALFGVGLGTTIRKFPNRWENRWDKV